jgi:hypothetical protein
MVICLRQDDKQVILFAIEDLLETSQIDNNGFIETNKQIGETCEKD